MSEYDIVFPNLLRAIYNVRSQQNIIKS